MDNNNSINPNKMIAPPTGPSQPIPPARPPITDGTLKPPGGIGGALDGIRDMLADISTFGKLDKDGDGQLSRLELEGTRKNIGKHDAYDKNNDGNVSKEEFLAARRREREMTKKDTNMDGRLTIDEFTAGLEGKALIKATKEFYRLDRDKSGTISQNEFIAGPPGKFGFDILKKAIGDAKAGLPDATPSNPPASSGGGGINRVQ